MNICVEVRCDSGDRKLHERRLGHSAYVVDLDDGTNGSLTVMCGHGERAMTAASILQSSGREVSVLVGGPADWAAATGTPLAAE